MKVATALGSSNAFLFQHLPCQGFVGFYPSTRSKSSLVMWDIVGFRLVLYGCRRFDI